MARRKKRRKAKKQKHRLYPLPKSYFANTAGICRWCGLPILREDGTIIAARRWHKECLHPYFLVTDSGYMKREIKKRDKGICARCGKKCKYRNEWNADHVKPLIDAKGDVSYWQLSNIQSLCNECHLVKTVAENKERMKKKSARK